MAIQIIPAKMQDTQLIHEMKYTAFLPLYERYHDEETNPVKDPPEKVMTHLESKNCDYWIITSDDKPVGAVRVVDGGTERQQQIYRISPLFILPAYQNQGIGYRTIQMLFAQYPQADIWRLSTILQEKGNCHLYEKCGFRRIGTELEINDSMTLIDYEKQMHRA